MKPFTSSVLRINTKPRRLRFRQGCLASEYPEQLRLRDKVGEASEGSQTKVEAFAISAARGLISTATTSGSNARKNSAERLCKKSLP